MWSIVLEIAQNSMYENQLEVYFSVAIFFIPVQSYPVHLTKSDQLYDIDHEYYFLAL